MTKRRLSDHRGYIINVDSMSRSCTDRFSKWSSSAASQRSSRNDDQNEGHRGTSERFKRKSERPGRVRAHCLGRNSVPRMFKNRILTTAAWPRSQLDHKWREFDGTDRISVLGPGEPKNQNRGSIIADLSPSMRWPTCSSRLPDTDSGNGLRK